MRGFSGMSRKATSASARAELQATLIAATRRDGLGSRLLAMANAKSVADAFGYRFGFTWNRTAVADKTFHVVDVVDRIFSAEFIERHWLGARIRESDFDVLDAAALQKLRLEDGKRPGNPSGWICDDFRVLDPFRGGEAGLFDASRALRSLGFSDSVRQATDEAARNRFPRPMAALHLRSGDIVRGKYRTRLVFGRKVIPATLAKAIVRELSSMGLATLLIGEDRATLDYLKAETGASLAEDFGAGAFEDRTQRAFFEMALMAQCQRIHAGSSIFASIASLMGGIPMIGTNTLFDKSRAAEIILDELKDRQADYHPLEAAFGYQAAFLNLEDRIGPAQARDILERAHGLDPQNDVYALKMASAYFREHDYPSGEAVLRSRMAAQFQARPQIPLPMMKVLGDEASGGFVLMRDFEFFLAAARAGYPCAAACSAWIRQQVSAERKAALAMARQAVTAEPANRMFRKIERRIRQGRKPKAGLLAKLRWRLAGLARF
ncbi:hypothetical protein [Mesorhizobium sp. M4B.F.Ca.ET.089.01.1.1]|uniref:hypothetical protein n=1 Tax=Mesorhizobium sp. M4B.F.Ca.ET.089.01.1.1 TaxID=2496662 RepID=UPI001FDF1FB4|nr:hypothetical protein [Mesorhizobium sp. M4B.F.Ca.ET.089.01.1.1]